MQPKHILFAVSERESRNLEIPKTGGNVIELGLKYQIFDRIVVSIDENRNFEKQRRLGVQLYAARNYSALPLILNLYVVLYVDLFSSRKFYTGSMCRSNIVLSEL